jgi:hypothetical protein
METHGEVEVEFQAFLTSALHWMWLTASRPGRFVPGKKSLAPIE